MDAVFIAAAVGFGLLWGSFLNVVIHRLPKTDIAGLRRRTPYTFWYLAYPPSFCPRCKTPIKPWHNVPMLSYLLLGGRSKCCGQAIHWSYPVIECCGALIGLLALMFGKGWLDMALIVFFLSVLLVNAVIDWRRYYLLDILTFPLLWVGLLANVDARFALLPDAVLGAAGGYVGIAVFAGLLSVVIGRRAMGMGDYKLLAALGAWLGWQPLPMLLFIAALLGIVFSAMRRLARGRGQHIPFGPALSMAGALMLLVGDEILLAYWRFISG